MKRTVTVLLAAVLALIIFTVPAAATAGDSFTHIEQPDGTYLSVLSRQLFTADEVITAQKLGLQQNFDGLTDLCYDRDGKVYILCGDSSMLVVLNRDYTLNTRLVITDAEGEVDFTGAQGVFVDRDNSIYISDTKNGRVLVTDQNGLVTKVLETPQSDLIPEDFVFQPTRVQKDDRGYVYILSSGCYYGALSYAPDGEFLGFYGANSVAATALETLAFLWDKITGNDAKKAAQVKSLPYSFVDFDLDAGGYLVTCTGVVNQNDNGTGQIRKIGPDGSNVLYKNQLRGGSATSSGFNFLERRVITKNTKPRPQSINSVAVSDTGYIYALDKTYGLIYVYDNKCNMLGALGGGLSQGQRLGVFGVPVSIAVFGETLLVADSQNSNVTVFNMTDFCRLLQQAQSMYLLGDYAEARPVFEQVLALDSGNPLAYRGLAVASLNAGDYTKALEYAENGMDYATYDLAYQTMFRGFLEKNFALVAGAILLLAGGIVALVVLVKKRRRGTVPNPRISTVAEVAFHPFKAFEGVKYKKQGSIIIATVLVLLYFLVSVIGETCSSFLFLASTPQNYSALYTLAKTVGLIALWSVSNWLICVLFSGKGKLAEVFIVTAYAFIPLIVWTFVSFLLSYILPLSAAGLLSGIGTVVILYTFFLLSIGIMTVHDFGFFKFLATALATVFAMLLVVFILFMIIIQIQRLWIFISSIFMEILYR